jgi:hypothetical protein
MRVGCPSCGQTVAGVDIDLAAGQALCRPCGAPFALASAPSSDALVPATAAPATLSRPSDLFNETRDAEGVCLAVGPGTVIKALGVTISVVIWLVTTIQLVGPILFGAGLLGLLLWLAFGLAIVFAVARRLTTYRVRLGRDGVLLVTPGDRRLPLSPLRCFISAEPGAQGTRRIHGICALTEDGQSIDLEIRLTSREHAEYLSQRLNQILDELRSPPSAEGR